MRNTGPEISVIDPGVIDESYIHVVAAIIWNQANAAQFLISQRPVDKHLGGYWELPGGKLEDGETPRQALQRELIEEVGIEVTAARPYLRVYHRYPERNVLLDTWSVDSFRGIPLAQERQLIAWVEIDRLDEFEFPAADGPVLQAIKNSVTA